MKYLSMCAVLRNESLYIYEWLLHHLHQGVEHFYLFQNDSEQNERRVAKPFENIITWHSTSGLCQQRVAYNHVIREYADETEWCCFFDIDEFAYTSKGKLSEVLRNDYDNPTTSGIAIHWLLFGSNGHIEYSPEPVKKRFTKRASNVNAHVKSIMRLSETYSMNLDPHSFLAKGDIIDENFTVMSRDYAITTPATADVIRLNHYVTKSREEYRLRKTLPDANAGIIKTFEQMWDSHNINEVEDNRINEI